MKKIILAVAICGLVFAIPATANAASLSHHKQPKPQTFSCGWSAPGSASQNTIAENTEKVDDCFTFEGQFPDRECVFNIEYGNYGNIAYGKFELVAGTCALNSASYDNTTTCWGNPVCGNNSQDVASKNGPTAWDTWNQAQGPAYSAPVGWVSYTICQFVTVGDPGSGQECFVLNETPPS